LIVALYHTLNHGVYKTLLFLEAGVIEHATRTRDLNRFRYSLRRQMRSWRVAIGLPKPPFRG
jgi:formate hydrogenlyase subunit 3/multisubunit Na+/H+ antiporter MnhD subunit